ncbi:MAG: hypothetical protein ACL93V_12370 [Candidatus Electrothrix sp. YB6]
MNRIIGIIDFPPLEIIRQSSSDRDTIVDLDESQLPPASHPRGARGTEITL